ncbi:diacylglycerol/lipid kinase family protein [Saccharopolyspora cebuensis]|uniref:Diacylglycerol kinase family protein n=1 Tax=Saccharopolyspora cebuensis TaxID=418759 RepID=A0ABV4CP79_9PSEU
MRRTRLRTEATDDRVRAPSPDRAAAIAEHRLLWWAAAACLALRKGRTRRVGLRGAVALAGAGAVTRWVRPLRSAAPTASAAAFATAATMESDWGAVLAPVAAGWVCARTRPGQRPVLGAAVGVAAALVTRHWWPVRPSRPGYARPVEQVAALESGRGLLLLVNAAAGLRDQTGGLAELWPEATAVSPAPGEDLALLLHRALDASPHPVRAIGVAGGDGTVAAAASVAATRRLPLVVVPAGTLNHFARDVGVTGPGDADRALRDGSAVHVDLGTVRIDDGPAHWFVNTASLGGYPDLVRLREKWAPRWGKWPAAAAALVRVLARAEPIPVRIDGVPRRIWLLFVGSSGYQPKGFAPSWRPHLDDGLLDIRYVRADLPFSRARFIAAALTGALARSHAYVQHETPRLLVEVDGAPVAVAHDGEIGRPGTRFEFEARDEALRVYRPDSP